MKHCRIFISQCFVLFLFICCFCLFWFFLMLIGSCVNSCFRFNISLDSLSLCLASCYCLPPLQSLMLLVFISSVFITVSLSFNPSRPQWTTWREWIMLCVWYVGFNSRVYFLYFCVCFLYEVYIFSGWVIFEMCKDYSLPKRISNYPFFC